MKRVYVSTVFRGRAGGEFGHVYVYDLDSMRLLADPRQVPTGNALSVMRSNSTGARGLCWWDGLLYIGGSGNKITAIDPDTLETVKVFLLPDVDAIHQIRERDGLLYVCNTGRDAVHVLGPSGRIVHKYDLRKNLSPAPWTDDDGLHVNSICWNHDGDLCAVLCFRSAFYNVARENMIWESQLADGSVVGPHDMAWLSRTRFLTNSSRNSRTVFVDLRASTTRVLLDNGHVEQGQSPGIQRNGFTRGLSYDNDTGDLLIGVTPTKIVHLRLIDDGRSERFVGEYVLPGASDESIYDICFDPRDRKGTQ